MFGSEVTDKWFRRLGKVIEAMEAQTQASREHTAAVVRLAEGNERILAALLEVETGERDDDAVPGYDLSGKPIRFD